MWRSPSIAWGPIEMMFARLGRAVAEIAIAMTMTERLARMPARVTPPDCMEPLIPSRSTGSTLRPHGKGDLLELRTAMISVHGLHLSTYIVITLANPIRSFALASEC